MVYSELRLPYLYLLAISTALSVPCIRWGSQGILEKLERCSDLLAYLPALLLLHLSLRLPTPMLVLELPHYTALALLLVAATVAGERLGYAPPKPLRLLAFTLAVLAGWSYAAAEAGVLAGSALLGAAPLITWSWVNLRPRLRAPALRLRIPRPGLRLRLPERGREEVYEEPEEPEEEEYRGYTFTVLVTDRRDNPLSGVRVMLRCPEAGIEEVRLTDTSGKCTFEALPQGRYTVVLDGEGIEKEEHQRYISMDHGEVFQVSLRAEELMVVVSDRATGMPIKGARVVLQSGGKRLEKRTDQVGIASFRELEGEELRLEVMAEGYRRYSRPVSLLAENVVSVALDREAEAKPEAREQEGEQEAGVEELCDVLSGEGALVYVQEEELPRVVEAVLREHLDAGRAAVLAGDPPEALEPHLQEGRLQLSHPEKLPESADTMPAGGLLVADFGVLEEALGEDGAVQVLSGVAEQLREEGVFFLCFSSRRVEKAEQAFTHVVELRGGRLRKLR